MLPAMDAPVGPPYYYADLYTLDPEGAARVT